MPITKTVDLKVNAGTTKEDLKDVQEGFEQIDETIEDIGETSKETQKEVGAFGTAMDKLTGGGYTGLMKMVTAIRKGNISLKAMKIALISTGIGAFVVAVGSLAANFGNSEAGANKLSKMLSQIGVITGNVTDILYSLSQGVVSFFQGNMEEASKSFKEATDRVKNFAKETKKEIALAGELSDKKADLAKIERKLTVDRAEADRKRADLLEKAADRDKFTALERIEFLKEAGAIEQGITDEEIKAAKLRLEIKQQENTLSESSAEDLKEEAELKAEVIRLDTARLTKQKEVTSQIIGARAEEKARLEAEANERQAEIDNFQKQRDDLDSILSKSVKGQEKAVIESTNILNDLKIKAKNDEIKREQITNRQKMDLTAQTLGQVTALLGENSAVGKAAAISQAVINSYLGFTEVLKTPTTIPEPFGSIQKAISAASILASGIQTVRKITAVQLPATKGASSSVGGGGAVASAAPTPPAFNVVGASETNQLAQSIGQDEKQPVKAYVVSNDVSTAQALDRNIVETASIG
jgi:hypothetical protein